ncbi:MAG TPA: hypothetical protein ENI23_14895 [bacterium]|nr:hypothetical protein [bacterium]
MSNYHNEPCKIAAKFLETEPGLLDYRLVEYLNKVFDSIKIPCRQLVTLAVVQWEEDKADNFTEHESKLK